MTIDQMIEMLQAAKRGEKLQCRAQEDRAWIDNVSGTPRFGILWRVKPKEPREFWIDVDDAGLMLGVTATKDYAGQQNGAEKTIHVREVLGDD